MDALINTLLKYGCVTKRFCKNQIIFGPEEDSDLVFLVTEGCAKVFLAYSNGKEFTLSLLGPGDFYSTHAATFIQAIDTTTVLLLPSRDFSSIIREHPGLVEHLLKGLGQTLKGTIHVIEQLAFKSVEARLAQFLLDNHQQRIVAVGLSQEEIAKLIGTSRPTISTLLNNWQKQNLIKMAAKTIQIIDLPRLMEMSR